MGFYEKEVERIFKDNDIHYEWWMQDDFSVVVVVEWGDWKHDHRYLINLVNYPQTKDLWACSKTAAYG